MAKNHNLLTESKIVEPFLSQILKNTKAGLEILNQQLQIKHTSTFGNVLVAVDSVSVILYDLENHVTTRCPLIGQLLHVEKLDGDANYNVYYKVGAEQVVVVDAIRAGKYQARRDLLLASKNGIKRVHTNNEFVLITDTENNIEAVSKKDIFSTQVVQALKASSFLIARNALFGWASRLFNSNFHAELFTRKDGLVLYVVGGSSHDLYRLELDERSMLPTSSEVKVCSLSSASKYDLSALNTFFKYAEESMLSISSVKILTACSDGFKAYVSVYNPATKEYEHRVLEQSEEGVKVVAKFTTDKAFYMNKLINLVYPSETKFLALEFASGGSKVKYFVVNSSFTVEDKGESASTVGDCSLLGIVSSTELSGISQEELQAAEEEIVE